MRLNGNWLATALFIEWTGTARELFVVSGVGRHGAGYKRA